MRRATRVICAGLPAIEQGRPFSEGVHFASAFHAAGEVSSISYIYGRYHNPTWTQFERALGELEEGIALSFASGTAAVMAVFGATLRTGDVIVLPSDSYYGTRVLAEGFFSEMGVRVRKAPTAGGSLAQLLDGAKLLWLESPSNPGLDVCDIAALAEEAHRKGVLVAVDNTTPTVLGQCPITLGADFSVASDSKSLTGHSDLILGHVAMKDPEWAGKLQVWRTQTGSIPGPMEVWLAYRSLSTLEMRLERQCRNAQMIAEYLSGHSKVAVVRYPGLANDPAHQIAVRQMQCYGSVVGFVVGDQVQAERFLNAFQLIIEATSFGGLHTTAERRARWKSDAIPEGFIRLSAGCEDGQDLIDDIAQALEAV